MSYLYVRWHHDDPDDPVELYSELDDDRWEVRKVEVYRNGKKDFAGYGQSTGTTRLGEVPIPPIDEFESCFQAKVISKGDFEKLWDTGPIRR